MVCVATLPALFGYRPVVVTSGSMEPAIRTADVVVTAGTDGNDLNVGMVIEVVGQFEFSVVGQFRLLAVSGPLPASGAWWWEDAARACGTCRVGVYGRRVGAQTTEAEAVLASLADGMTMAELDRLAGERASTMTETREQAGTLARYVYPDGSRLRVRRSSARPGALVDAVSLTGRLTASRLIDLEQTGTVPAAGS